MGLGDVGTPVTPSDGYDGEFGGDDGTSDSGCYFFGALDTETDVPGDQLFKPYIITSIRDAHGSRDKSTHPSKSPTATKALNLVR